MSLIGRLVNKLLKKGSITIVSPGGKRGTYGPGGGRRLTVRFADNRVGFEILKNPRLGLGEAYMNGRLVVEDGTILDLIELVTNSNRWQSRPTDKQTISVIDVRRIRDGARAIIGTIETLSHFRHFHSKVPNGTNFVAVTDPGSPLVDVANEHRFRSVFLNDPDIGGRYSALSYFGLVPAALMGVDVRGLLERAEVAEQACANYDHASSNSGRNGERAPRWLMNPEMRSPSLSEAAPTSEAITIGAARARILRMSSGRC